MEDIVFSTGIKEYTINGEVSLKFNPTDAAFMERIYSLFVGLDELQNKLNEMREDANPENLFDIFREIDKKMRARIDNALDAPVSDAVFGRMNAFALADGVPAWVNLMFAILDKIPAEMRTQEGKTNAALNKYMKKYQK